MIAFVINWALSPKTSNENVQFILCTRRYKNSQRWQTKLGLLAMRSKKSWTVCLWDGIGAGSKSETWAGAFSYSHVSQCWMSEWPREVRRHFLALWNGKSRGTEVRQFWIQILSPCLTLCVILDQILNSPSLRSHTHSTVFIEHLLYASLWANH